MERGFRIGGFGFDYVFARSRARLGVYSRGFGMPGSDGCFSLYSH